MNYSAAVPEFETAPRWARQDFQILFLIVIFALILRLVFFTGFYGSDEVTYFQMARSIQDGNWERSDYIGSIRYGVNIPIAVFLKFFGVSEFAANFWSLLTSLAEVILVCLAAKHMWGVKPALVAGLLLAALPLHVHYAGRLMADAPLAFFVSLCFIAVWMAEKKNSAALYLLAGISVGSIFWVKDAVFYLTIALLGAYLLLAHRWHIRWFWMALGALIVVLLNCLLMWIIYDNPFHLLSVSFNSFGRANSLSVAEKKPPEFYFLYLLIDIKHTFLLFYLALGGVFLALRENKFSQVMKRSEGFIFLWAFGFIVLLSMLSLKQVNYMLIFVAPLILFSAYFISSLNRKFQVALIGLVIVGGVVLAAFEQQAVQSFTANSRASVAFAELHPDAVVFAGTGAVRAEIYQKALGQLHVQRPSMMSLSDLDALLESKVSPTNPPSKEVTNVKQAFAIMDPQTADWGAPEDSRWSKRQSSPCLVRGAELVPAAMGYGRYIVDALVATFAALPEPLATKISTKLTNTLRPQSATVFQIGAPCFVPGA